MKALGQYDVMSVLITGCNRGMGLEMVKFFVNNSGPETQIFATSRRSSEALSELGKRDNVHLITLEVTKPDSVKDAAAKVTEILGGKGLNLLINNAAITGDNVYRTVKDTTPEEMTHLYDVNVSGSHSVTAAFYPLLKISGTTNSNMPLCAARAAIVNFSSITASVSLAPFFGQVVAFPYAITKCAVNMLTKLTAHEFKEDGIMCVAVHPGWVDTDMGRAGGGQGETAPEEAIKDMTDIMAGMSEEHNGMYLKKGLEKLPF